MTTEPTMDEVADNIRDGVDAHVRAIIELFHVHGTPQATVEAYTAQLTSDAGNNIDRYHRQIALCTLALLRNAAVMDTDAPVGKDVALNLYVAQLKVLAQLSDRMLTSLDQAVLKTFMEKTFGVRP